MENCDIDEYAPWWWADLEPGEDPENVLPDRLPQLGPVADLIADEVECPF